MISCKMLKAKLAMAQLQPHILDPVTSWHGWNITSCHGLSCHPALSFCALRGTTPSCPQTSSVQSVITAYVGISIDRQFNCPVYIAVTVMLLSQQHPLLFASSSAKGRISGRFREQEALLHPAGVGDCRNSPLVCLAFCKVAHLAAGSIHYH